MPSLQFWGFTNPWKSRPNSLHVAFLLKPFPGAAILSSVISYVLHSYWTSSRIFYALKNLDREDPHQLKFLRLKFRLFFLSVCGSCGSRVVYNQDLNHKRFRHVCSFFLLPIVNFPPLNCTAMYIDLFIWICLRFPILYLFFGNGKWQKMLFYIEEIHERISVR